MLIDLQAKAMLMARASGLALAITLAPLALTPAVTNAAAETVHNSDGATTQTGATAADDKAAETPGGRDIIGIQGDASEVFTVRRGYSGRLSLVIHGPATGMCQQACLG